MKISELRDLSKDVLLGALGLQSKLSAADWVAPCVGIFAAGLLLGAGLGLLFAPKSGVELRGEIADRISAGTEKATVRIEAPA